ncbi:hypothetical protein DU508_19775 [Pedobacter chinensis]|uniref:Uncharacterized protein n=1 Tax=Pedobacter chinensis TaxID=2282421 RepID=A0A369PU14_9SPHI|nr:hypothetical protein DU508_19775 [Pedobacter chinensis]
MFKCFFKYSALFAIATFALACSNTNNKPIIKFSRDSSSIIIKNFDETSLLQVRNSYLANPDSNSLVSVLVQPGELDSLQDEILVPGKIKISGDSLVFNPDQPFRKDNTYVVESFINVQFATAGKLITGKVKYNLQPQRQILKR